MKSYVDVLSILVGAGRGGKVSDNMDGWLLMVASGQSFAHHQEARALLMFRRLPIDPAEKDALIVPRKRRVTEFIWRVVMHAS